jgi:hypothetical protein
VSNEVTNQTALLNIQKDMFFKYLEHVKHPKTDDIFKAKIQKVKISWATETNVVDCAIYLMRHMERHMGSGARFNTGLSSHGMKKKGQLNQLRKKYAAHILLSDANEMKKKIVREVLGK